MTRKEFFAKDRTWKSAALRLAVTGGATRTSYTFQMFHMGVGQASSVKHITMSFGMNVRARALATRLFVYREL